MSYMKNIWANGDTITAEKLNNIEDGVAANNVAAEMIPLVINATATLDGSSFTPSNIDKTPAQLAAAVAAKVPVFMRLVVTVPAEEEGADDIVAVQQVPLSQSIGTGYNFCSTPDVDAEDGLTVIKAELEVDGNSFIASGTVYQVAVGS